MKETTTDTGKRALEATDLKDLSRTQQQDLGRAVLHVYLRNQDRTALRAHWHSLRAGYLLGWVERSLRQQYGLPVFCETLCCRVLRELVRKERLND